jgi:hypothetical protein
MAFTVNNFADLRQLLYLHPEWRAELQQLLMPDDMLNMPAVLRELAQSHQRAERRLDRVEATLAEPARFEKRSEARLERLEATVAELGRSPGRSLTFYPMQAVCLGSLCVKDQDLSWNYVSTLT